MNEKLTYIKRILSGVFALIITIFTFITQNIDVIKDSQRCEIAKTNIVGIDAYFHSQGMATDGETFFFSSKTTLIQTSDDYKTIINANYSAIPEELSKNYSIKHIGGISYYNGYIYAGLEDSKQWHHPIIGVFDAKTLELVKYYHMDPQVLKKGVPWVCVEPEIGLLYCANHYNDTTKLLIYDAENDMSPVGEIVLDKSVSAIQGAEFFGGYLYAATADDTQAIYKINPSTGEVKKLLDRNLVKPGEGEGMTIIVRDGKPVLLAMDMGTLFVNAFIREYELNTQA